MEDDEGVPKDPVLLRLHAISLKLDQTATRLTVIETQMTTWRSTVMPMLTGFVGVVAGVILAVFALRG